MKGKITSLQVAARAGVSQSAVSRVFSGASASAATAEKVRQAAAELGYRPNVLARSLITGRSRIIGLVVAYLDNPFYPDALERLSRALQARGYHILIFMAGNDAAEVDQLMNELLDYQADGIITASVGVSPGLVQRCEAANIPVVMFNRGQEGTSLAQVTSDNLAGGRRVAEFLLAGGHRRIAHVSGWQGSSTGRDRTTGFLQELARQNAECVGQIDGMYRRDDAAEAARRLMAQAAPDAIFVGNDHMAFAVMDVLRAELALDVPGDVSVVGYDDVPMAGWPAYDLTTVRQPVGQMVEATLDALLGAIEGRTVPPVTRVDGPLIVRGSARVPEGWQ